MKVVATDIPDVLLIQPRTFGDSRGFFVETWQQTRYAEYGINASFVQDNLAASKKGVLRGLHLQHPHSQGKLVQVILGAVFDVAVDVRQGSPWFGRWVGAVLSGDNRHQFWVPPGFAHGYYVLSDDAVFAYKCTDVYSPEHELVIRWDDPNLAINWPLENNPVISTKDQAASLLIDIAPQKLPRYAH